MTVHMTFTDIEDYNMRSIANLGCNMYSQITVARVTLPKAVLNTVKTFAVHLYTSSFPKDILVDHFPTASSFVVIESFLLSIKSNDKNFKKQYITYFRSECSVKAM